MALKAIVESLDGLSDEVRALYAPGAKDPDGKFDLTDKFLLQVEAVDGFTLEPVAALKKALGQERENHKQLKAQLAEYEDIDIAQAREALQKVDEMKNWKPDDKIREQIEQREQQLLEKHKKDMAERDAVINSQKAEIEDLLIVSQASESINKHKGNVEVLLPHVKMRTRIEKDAQGKSLVRIIDPADGTVRMTMKTGSTEMMGIDELVEEMKASNTFASCFEGSGATGSGATGTTGNGARISGNELSKLPPIERMKHIREES